MKNFIPYFIYQLIIVTIFVGTAILPSCSNQESALAATSMTSPILKTVQVQKAQAIDYQNKISSTGKIIDGNAFEMSFNQSGKILKVLVHEGQEIIKGQLLAILEVKMVEVSAQKVDLEIEQANISIKNKTLLLQKARRDFENISGLYQDSVATLEQFENAKTEVQTIENQLLQTQQSRQSIMENRKAIAINIDATKIIAPANGIVLKNHKKENEITRIGEPVFLIAPQSNTKVLQAFVSDKEVVQIKKGDDAEVTFDVFAEKKFKGKVVEIASMADPASNKFGIKIRINPATEKLFLGFIGNVLISSAETRPLISIPVNSLLDAEGKKGNILIVEEERVNKKEVTIHKMEDNQLLLRSGLEVGELVVTSGSGNITNGEKVQVNTLEKASSNNFSVSAKVSQ